MGKITILPETTLEPITLIGERAGVCWGADTSDAGKNYQRGWDCITSGHGRTLEFVNVEMLIEGYSAKVLREWYTHIGGAPTRLQESTRYSRWATFPGDGYVIPHTVQENAEALSIYKSAQEAIRCAYFDMIKVGVPTEDASYLLPMGMESRMVDKRNLRNLIDMSRQRMCARALWEFREMFDDICEALTEYSEEWNAIITTQFKPKCDVLGYCPEKHGCGKYPKEADNA